jgi:hypothetical protein
MKIINQPINMGIIMKIANLLFLLSLVFSYAIAQDDANKSKESKEAEVTVTVDLEKKKITFPVQLISSEQMLEVFACTEQGPTHETVLLIEQLGIKLHNGIKQLGLTEALHWQYPLEDGYQLTMGDKVMMKIYFEGTKEEEAVFVEDLLVFDHTGTNAFLRGWSFKGDQQTVEGKVSPMADVEFSLINKGRNKSPMTLLLNPSNFFMIDEPEYKIAPKIKPLLKKLTDAQKTKGTIILTPATEEIIAIQNAKRYEDKSGLLVKNIELAKQVDILKKKFISEISKELMDTIKKGSAEGISETDKAVQVQKHQILALEANCVLLEINYIYHQMAKNEYQFLLTTMPPDLPSTKNYKSFAVDLIGYLTQEVYYKLQANKEEALVLNAKNTNQTNALRIHETKKTINLIMADLQPLLFRQVALQDQIEAEKIRLKEPDVADSKIMIDTFEKSIAKANLEKNFYKGLETYYLNKTKYLLDTIKEGVDASKISDAIPSGVATKISILEAVNYKFAILEFAHKDRIKSLNGYMIEDKKEAVYYQKKIAETQSLLENIQKASIEIKKLIEAKAPNMSIEDLEKNYKDHLKPQ